MQETSDSLEDSAEPGEDVDGAASLRRPGFSPLTFLAGFGAGAFVGVALALLAYAMVDRDGARVSVAGSIEPDAPPAVSGMALPTPDTRTRTIAALDVHLGPGTGFAIVGLLAKGEAVEVVGRDNDSQWLAIRFPPGSSGRGWIPVSGVEFPPELSALTVALPTPIPRTIATPRPADFGDDGPPLSGTTATPAGRAATATAQPGLPDLVVVSAKVLPDRRVAVTVGNRGPGDLVGFTVFAQVRDLIGESELMNAPVPSFRAGATLTLETSSFRISGEMTVLVSVDPFGSAPDIDRSNNTVRVVLAAPVAATPTP